MHKHLIKLTILASTLVSPMYSMTEFTNDNGCIDSVPLENTLCYQENLECSPCIEPPMFHGHILALGPEWYHVNRKKKGGTKQDGSCLGVRFNYDHIKRYKIYYGVQAFYGSGVLHGHTSGGNKLHSRLNSGQVEGSLGYTFQAKFWNRPWITPIVGYGYYHESNSFSHPSPLTLKYVTKYTYVPFGFLSGIMLTPSISLGLNVRVRYPIEPKCRISKDPDFDHVDQRIEEEFGWRLELPFVYKTDVFCRSLLVGFLPFYEVQNYGGRANYPFDYIKTKFETYGANVQIMYQF